MIQMLESALLAHVYEEMNDTSLRAEASAEYQEVRQRLENELKDLVAENPSMMAALIRYSDMVTELQRIREDYFAEELVRRIIHR